MKARFFNITFVCVYAPTEEADEEVKDTFYNQLEQEIDQISKHDVKIVIGDLNANVGREEAFHNTVGKESLHEYSNDNGLRLIDFAMSNLMVVRSTKVSKKEC
jgi:exonuclease III